MVEIVRALDALGQLDYFTVSGSTGETPRYHQKLMPFADAAPGVYAPLAARIKKEVRIPVIYAGRVVDPRHADRLLAEGACDLVAMTRALMADPWMPRKAAEGRLDDIRMCVGMQEGCLGRSSRGLTLSCSQNPVTGREARAGGDRPARQCPGASSWSAADLRVSRRRGSPRCGATRSSSTSGRPRSAARCSSPPARRSARATASRSTGSCASYGRPPRPCGSEPRRRWSASSPTGPTRWWWRRARSRGAPTSPARPCPAW